MEHPMAGGRVFTTRFHHTYSSHIFVTRFHHTFASHVCITRTFASLGYILPSHGRDDPCASLWGGLSAGRLKGHEGQHLVCPKSGGWSHGVGDMGIRGRGHMGTAGTTYASQQVGGRLSAPHIVLARMAIW